MKIVFKQNFFKKFFWWIITWILIFQWIFFVNADDTTPPTAEELRFFDSDWNNKIDTIYIKFNETLTWTLVKSVFRIASQAWWFKENSVSSAADISSDILNSEIIQWNILKVTITKAYTYFVSILNFSDKHVWYVTKMLNFAR